MTGDTADLPLRGLSVLVPRPAGSGADLLAALRGAGAVPRHVPLIETRPATTSAMARAVAALAAGEFDWVAFTSAAAVAAVAAIAEREHLARPVAAGTRVAAVGAATARELRRAGIAVDLLPTGQGSAAALAAAWPAEPGGRRVLLPRSDLARPELVEALRSKGYRVETVTAYRTVTLPLPEHAAQELADGTIGAVLLTSPSTAHALADRPLAAGTIVIAIGATTARAAAASGLPVTATAATPDAAGLLAALLAAAARRRTGTP